MAFALRKLNTPSGANKAVRELQVLLMSSASGIVAYAGGGATLATALTKAVNHVGTVATAGDSVKLRAVQLGVSQVVINGTATSMNVFPATGEAINALANDAAYAVAAGKTVRFYGGAAGKTFALLSA
jgi:hypothetical protein